MNIISASLITAIVANTAAVLLAVVPAKKETKTDLYTITDRQKRTYNDGHNGSYTRYFFTLEDDENYKFLFEINSDIWNAYNESNVCNMTSTTNYYIIKCDRETGTTQYKIDDKKITFLSEIYVEDKN